MLSNSNKQQNIINSLLKYDSTYNAEVYSKSKAYISNFFAESTWNADAQPCPGYLL